MYVSVILYTTIHIYIEVYQQILSSLQHQLDSTILKLKLFAIYSEPFDVQISILSIFYFEIYSLTLSALPLIRFSVFYSAVRYFCRTPRDFPGLASVSRNSFEFSPSFSEIARSADLRYAHRDSLDGKLRIARYRKVSLTFVLLIQHVSFRNRAFFILSGYDLIKVFFSWISAALYTNI